MQIAMQMMDGVGTHLAHHIHFIAWHYQLFEQLPPKKQGRYLNRSLLSSEQVQMAVRTHLTSLPTGEVTPSCFHHMLNKCILPSLGYTLKNKLSECTAWWWLTRLGWRNQLLRKGVYMDGHERLDVVEYCNQTFLPLMAEYQKRMAKWELQGFELMRTGPKSGSDEMQIIALFQDESCFHANEYKRTIWCIPLLLFPRECSYDLGKEEAW